MKAPLELYDRQLSSEQQVVDIDIAVACKEILFKRVRFPLFPLQLNTKMNVNILFIFALNIRKQPDIAQYFGNSKNVKHGFGD